MHSQPIPSRTAARLAVIVMAAVIVHQTLAFSIASQQTRRNNGISANARPSLLPVLTNTKQDEDYAPRTTFDEAGASLIEEEDRQKLEQMGDFDSNPAVSTFYIGAEL